MVRVLPRKSANEISPAIMNFFFYEVALTTFAVYTLNGHELTASKAFVAWTLFSLIRLQLTAFPDCIVGLFRVSIPGDLFPDGVLVRSSR